MLQRRDDSALALQEMGLGQVDAGDGMVEYFVERYSNLAREKLGIDTLDTQLTYSIRLYCYGTVGMTREWLMKDNITPAQTVVQMMFNSMPESLKKLYFE